MFELWGPVLALALSVFALGLLAGVRAESTRLFRHLQDVPAAPLALTFLSGALVQASLLMHLDGSVPGLWPKAAVVAGAALAVAGVGGLLMNQLRVWLDW